MKVLTSILLLLISVASYAQDSMPLDERGKFIVYEVVDAKATPMKELAARAEAFFQKGEVAPLKMTASADSVFNGEGSFLISKNRAILTHPLGQILYNLTIGIKDDRYRYWLTDFRFIAYQRDRYGNFSPVSTRSVPLETPPGKLKEKEWKSYTLLAAAQAKEIASVLRQHMATASTAPADKKVISTGKW